VPDRSGGLGRYLLHRLLLVIPTLIGVTVISFAITYLLPGNPALVKAGPLATPEYVRDMERRMGLDQPVYVQYWRYVQGVLRGDLGESTATGRPVIEDFVQRVPATLELTLASLLIAVAVGIPLGVLSAVHRDSVIDHVSRVAGVTGVAMPSFWTGLLLLYVFFYLLGLAPAPLGRLSPGVTPPPTITGLYVVDSLLTGHRQALLSSLHQLMLPAATLGFAVMAPLTRMVRATMLEILESDFIKAAWAAGLPRRRVVYGDALGNALVPVITLLGVIFGFLMAGNVVVEIVFAWPGIGNYAVTSLMTKDPAPIQSFVLFVALVYVLVNLGVDLLYGLADPRIRLR
jgi:peptide/nickel transport system permease protein